MKVQTQVTENGAPDVMQSQRDVIRHRLLNLVEVGVLAFIVGVFLIKMAGYLQVSIW